MCSSLTAMMPHSPSTVLVRVHAALKDEAWLFCVIWLIFLEKSVKELTVRLNVVKVQPVVRV